jgi:hypothetical protein
MREKVATSVRRLLRGLPPAARTGPLAVAALVVASRLDAPETEDRDVAGLTRELRLVLVALEETAGAGAQGDQVDELLSRREARRASR